MKLVKIDRSLVVPERRPYRIFHRMKYGYLDIECPFCGKRGLYFSRNLVMGSRCKNAACRAMLRCHQGGTAERDMVPLAEAARAETI